MECDTVEETSIPLDESNVKRTNSAESFQKFIYELFEKNGILNDLRAYLRGHIVNVLKSADTGDPPVCQKHFTQRLELTFQALNILIAEYLFCMEFSYSLSVFVSEIPLANMVFGFAKSLLQNSDRQNLGLRFSDSDVWCILNYLGIKCDSEHATNIIDMYRNRSKSLLLCILKCVPMYVEPACMDDVNTSQESLSSNDKSTSTLEDRNSSARRKASHHTCKHYAFCKACRNRVRQLKDKYRKKKTRIAENLQKSKVNPLNVESFMKNVTVLEEKLIEEMFDHLKSVYETEIDMVKQEEQNKVKRSLANHALLLQQQRDELESELRMREVQLEERVQQKKRFVWGLAKTLREQQRRVEAALSMVRSETERLADQESSLKAQLKDAEEMLKRKGEHMRKQISDELLKLGEHLESMKKERDDINRERQELESLKQISETNINVMKSNLGTKDLEHNYILMKDELSSLKKYIESNKDRKVLIERGTDSDVGVLNNEQSGSDRTEDKMRPCQVVNDLKKQKVVNFSQSNLDDIYRDLSRERGRSYACSDHGCDVIQQLRAENDRLKELARQQESHLEVMSLGLRAQAQLTLRPRTAPPFASTPASPRVHPTASTSVFGWRKGAGEELSLFPGERVLVPGDVLPFIGVLRDRHPDSRRHLINQWKTLRHRVPPNVSARVPARDRSPGVARGNHFTFGPDSPYHTRPSSVFYRTNLSAANTGLPGTSNPVPPHEPGLDPAPHHSGTMEKSKPSFVHTFEAAKSRDKSPKSVLREAKEKLRNKDSVKESPPLVRDKSPNAMLREAKLRLRKLEIEAEAVEKSYLTFRKRREALRGDNNTLASVGDKNSLKDDDSAMVQTTPSHHGVNASCELADTLMKQDFDKYLREYQSRFDIGNIRFKNENSALKVVKPIPDDYSKVVEEIDEKNSPQGVNYLEAPMTEFRKYYQSLKANKSPKIESNILKSPVDVDGSDSRNDETRDQKRKAKELEILKNNIEKIYNLRPHDSVIPTNSKEIVSEDDKQRTEEKLPQGNNVNDLVKAILKTKDLEYHSPKNTDNLLEVEIENGTNEIKATESKQDLLIVVESSVDNRDEAASDTECDENNMSPQMTIFVSPKDKVKSPIGVKKSPRSTSPHTFAKLTKDDMLNAIYHADNKEASSVDIQLQLNTEHLDNSLSGGEKGLEVEYPDDFSADVDNYNSRSDCGNNSPISVLKTSEDENFWDS